MDPGRGGVDGEKDDVELDNKVGVCIVLKTEESDCLATLLSFLSVISGFAADL